LTNYKEYRQVENDFINWIKQTKGTFAAIKASQAETLTRIEALKQKAVEGKMKQAIDWISNHLEVNGKLVVFATHKFVIDQLMETFKDITVKIDGSTSMTERQKAVDEFQTNDRVRLFVGNIKAAGVGLTLTASSNVAFLEFPWTPGNLDQASDRCHRIGQKDNVTVYYLMAEGTIENDIATMLDSKRKVLNQVLDGQDAQQETLLNELINKYYNL
jgi:SWI/SNF-related matrix-associated actin-dependent regulator of chromatin subfamily A-like protein 1